MLSRVYSNRFTFGAQLSRNTGIQSRALLVTSILGGTLLGAWEGLYPRWDKFHIN